MNETGRVTSTARKIRRSWLWRLFWIFFRLNLVLLILAVLGFCYFQERSALGDAWTPELQRELEIGYVVDFDHAFVGRNQLKINITEQRG